VVGLLYRTPPAGALVTEKQLWQLAEQVMTDAQHRVFWLHHHEGFSQRQIARMEGCARSSVQSRLEGGRQRLLEAVKQQEAA
jgi:DNA-directed RNA polymerase specialized sigma24 family protein